MADLENYIASNTTKVGPAPTTEDGSTRDDQRHTDFGDFSNVTPAQIRAATRVTPDAKLSNMEKFARFQTAAQSAVEVAAKGEGTSDELLEGAEAGYKEYTAAPRNTRTGPKNTKALDKTDTTTQDMGRIVGQNAIEQEYRKGVTAGDQASAAFREFTGTAALYQAAKSWAANLPEDDLLHGLITDAERKADFKPDPTFNAMEGREVWGAGKPVEDQEWIAGAQSAEEREYRLGQLNRRDENLRTLGAHGAGVATFLGFGAGIMDPVGWVAGLGVGKAAQIARTGQQLSGAAKVLAGAAEGAAGNVMITATQQAAGDHVLAADYGYAATFGAIFGGAGSAMRATAAREMHPDNADPELHAEADNASRNATAQAQAIQEGNTAHMSGIWEEAQRRAGPGADMDGIAQIAKQVEYERAAALREAAHAPLPDNQRLMPDIEELRGQQPLDHPNAEPTSMDGSLTSAIEAEFSPLAERMEVGKRYGVTADTIPDNAERLFATEALLRAERNAPPIEAARLNTLSRALPNKLQATAMILGRSEHPLARWVAGNLLESPTGATGGRPTAAVDHALREREYNSFLGQYNDIYAAWRNQNGGSTLKDIFTKAGHWGEFNRAVTQARRDRAMGIPTQEHPLIREAADVMDAGYNRLAEDQIGARTLGSERLKGLDSRGYFSRVIDAKWLIANPGKRNAIRGAIEKQLAESWHDISNGSKFAKETAARYIDRAIREANGSGQAPANVFDPHAAPALRDALAQGTNLSEKDIDLYLERIGRAGAKHTRGRLDLDLNTVLKDDNGVEFQMGDAFVSDQNALFRSQSRRVNGEVSLTRYGIQGEKGFRQIADLAMLRHEPGKQMTAREQDALQQVIAEFTGKPYGNQNGTLNNLRLLTMVSKLGQAVFPQLAETASLATTLGVQAAMRFTKDMPRLIQDVRKGRPSPLLDSLELPGGRIGDEHSSVMAWQNLDEIELAGRDAPGMLDRALRAGANAQSLATGFRYVHAAQVRGASEQILMKVAKQVRDGGDDKALRSMGLSAELQTALRNDLKNWAKFDKDGNLTNVDIRSSADPQAVLALQQLVERGAKQIIQGTFIGERGAYVHDSFLKILTQFRTFSIVSMDKQFSRIRADQGTAKALGLLLGQMSFAVPIHLARVQLNAATMDSAKRQEYLDTQLSAGMLARATLNYASIGGLLGDVVDAGAALGGLEMSGVRSGQSSFSGNIPAIGYADGLVRGITNKDPSALIKSLPGGSTVFLTPITNGLNALKD